MAPYGLFADVKRKHAAGTLLRCRNAFAMSVQEPQPVAAGTGLICLQAVRVPYILPAAGTSFCVAADALPKRKFAGSAGRMTIQDRHRPCPQSDHQQLSSGTVPPMFVFARAGFTRPGADAIPAPRAGAARDETGAAGFKCPLGVMPSAPCSSWTVCAR